MQDSPTELLVKKNEILHSKQRASKTQRDALGDELKDNLSEVLTKNLQSGSYVLEQDGSHPPESITSQRRTTEQLRVGQDDK